MTGRRVATAAVLAAVVALGAATPAGAATTDEGRVTLKLDRGLRGSLMRNGVRVRAATPAEGRGPGVINLPVTDGGMERSGKGRLVTQGGIAFEARGRQAIFRNLVFDTAFGKLSGRLDGLRLVLATPSRLSRQLHGFTVEVGARRMTLTRDGAAAINASLGVPGLVRAGQRLASATSVSPIAHIPVLDGQAYIAFAPAFAAKLKILNVNVKALGDAWSGGSRDAPTVAVTHLAGEAAPDFNEGIIESDGGYAFKRFGSSAEVAVHDVRFNFSNWVAGGSVTSGFTLPAEAGLTRFAEFQLSVTHKNPVTGVLSTPNSPARLTRGFAQRLNRALAEPNGRPGLFVEGEPLAEVAFNLRTRSPRR
jgi:hypothetical protein